MFLTHRLLAPLFFSSTLTSTSHANGLIQRQDGLNIQELDHKRLLIGRYKFHAIKFIGKNSGNSDDNVIEI